MTELNIHSKYIDKRISDITPFLIYNAHQINLFGIYIIYLLYNDFILSIR